MYWLISIIPALRLRQEDCFEFKAILDYRLRLYSQKQ